MNNDRGFSLIELLVVVILIAILATIAVPTYHRYINKSRATAALTLVQPARLAVNEYAMVHHGQLSDVSNDTLDLASDKLTFDSTNVDAITIDGTSDTAVAIKATLADNLGTLTWHGNYNAQYGAIDWQCTYPADSELAHYAPHGCQADN